MPHLIGLPWGGLFFRAHSHREDLKFMFSTLYVTRNPEVQKELRLLKEFPPSQSLVSPLWCSLPASFRGGCSWSLTVRALHCLVQNKADITHIATSCQWGSWESKIKTSPRIHWHETRVSHVRTKILSAFLFSDDKMRKTCS